MRQVIAKTRANGRYFAYFCIVCAASTAHCTADVHKPVAVTDLKPEDKDLINVERRRSGAREGDL
jgi:hypothetical protein